MTFAFDASREFSRDWKEGPAESAVSISVGMLLNNEAEIEKRVRKKTSKYFPHYDEMKKRQKKMRKEITD